MIEIELDGVRLTCFLCTGEVSKIPWKDVDDSEQLFGDMYGTIKCPNCGHKYGVYTMLPIADFKNSRVKDLINIEED